MYSSSQRISEYFYTAVPEQALFVLNSISCSPVFLQIKGKKQTKALFQIFHTISNLSSFLFHWDWVHSDVPVQRIQCVRVLSLNIYLEERSYKEISTFA